MLFKLCNKSTSPLILKKRATKGPESKLLKLETNNLKRSKNTRTLHEVFQPAKKSHSCLRWDCILIFFLANVTKVKNPDFKENPKGRKQLKKGSERTEPQKSTNDVADGHENEEQSP